MERAKRILILSVLVILIASYCTAQNTNLKHKGKIGITDLEGNVTESSALTYDIQLLPGQNFTGIVYFWSANQDPVTGIFSVQSNFYLAVSPSSITSNSCNDVKWINFVFSAPSIPGNYTATVSDINNYWNPIYVNLTVTNNPTLNSFSNTIDIVLGCFNIARDTVRWNGGSSFLGCTNSNYPTIGGIPQSLDVNYYLHEGQVGWLIFSPPTFTIPPSGSVEVIKTFAGNVNLPNSVWEIRTRNWYSFPRFIKWTKNIINPPEIVMNYPANNMIISPENVTFDWNDYPFAHNYGFQISKFSNFSSLVFNIDSMQNSNYAIANGILQSNTQYYWRVKVRRQGCGEIISAPYSFTTINPVITLNTTLYLQGLFNANSNTQIPDTVEVQLRNVSSPYSMVESVKGIVTSAGTLAANFLSTPTGNYYIVVKHRNSIETWSRNGGISLTAGGTSSYNFSNSISQAFGNNLILLGTKYCIYSGDVNRDGSVDVSDLSPIDNDAYNYATGYLQTDLNGDNFVDVIDATIADNNSFNYVSLIRP